MHIYISSGLCVSVTLYSKDSVRSSQYYRLPDILIHWAYCSYQQLAALSR